MTTMTVWAVRLLLRGLSSLDLADACISETVRTDLMICAALTDQKQIMCLPTMLL